MSGLPSPDHDASPERRRASGGHVVCGPQRRNAAVSLAFVSRLTTLIDGLLEVTRVASGALELSFETFDLREPVRAAIASARDAAARVGATITLAAPHAVVGFWDRNALQSVAYALLSNAVKYGSRKPIEVMVEAHGRRARLVVRDHGIGVADVDVERIFTRFERAVSHDQTRGFGLGLWVTRYVVEAHGGTVSLASTLGEGATFTVELPVTGES